MALPTHGRVLLDTTAGDIDIELWSKVRGRDGDERLNVSPLVNGFVTTHPLLCRKHRKRAGTSSRWPWKVTRATVVVLFALLVPDRSHVVVFFFLRNDETNSPHKNNNRLLRRRHLSPVSVTPTHPIPADARVSPLTPSATPEKRSPRLSRADG